MEMTSSYPAGRIQLDELAPRTMAAMFRLEGAIQLDQRLADLVKVRASQLNGCAFCIDMHWQDARAHGEGEERLYSLDAWRHSPLFHARERAALELCEAITLVAEGHVPDPVWDRARSAFDDQELAQLVFAITAINAWNRLMITARVEPGHYRPALRDAA
jgi:AhpD family alkylhydroperoxidase